MADHSIASPLGASMHDNHTLEEVVIRSVVIIARVKQKKVKDRYISRCIFSCMRIKLRYHGGNVGICTCPGPVEPVKDLRRG